MTPKFEIFHTNAFEWLVKRDQLSIHAVVTDPPFGVIEYLPDQLKKKRNGKGGIWRLPQNYDGNNRNPMPRFTVLRPSDLKKISAFHSRLARLLDRVLVPGGHVIMASQNLLSYLVISKYVDIGFEIRGQIVRIVKTLRGGDRPKGAHERYPDVSVNPRSSWEPWLIFRKPCEGRVSDNLDKWGTGALRRPHRNKPFRDLIESRPARGIEKENAPHPSLKPQAFMRQIVHASLPLGNGVILDPFMGSGSTIAAAKSHNLESIGLEIDDIYFKMAELSIPKLADLEVKEQEEM